QLRGKQSPALPQHQAEQEGDAEHVVAELVQPSPHQQQPRPHRRLVTRLGKVHYDARQVEHGGHPGDHEQHVEALDPQIDHRNAPPGKRNGTNRSSRRCMVSGGRHKDRACDPCHVKVAKDQGNQDLMRSPELMLDRMASGFARGVGVSAGSVGDRPSRPPSFYPLMTWPDHDHLPSRPPMSTSLGIKMMVTRQAGQQRIDDHGRLSRTVSAAWHDGKSAHSRACPQRRPAYWPYALRCGSSTPATMVSAGTVPPCCNLIASGATCQSTAVPSASVVFTSSDTPASGHIKCCEPAVPVSRPRNTL